MGRPKLANPRKMRTFCLNEQDYQAAVAFARPRAFSAWVMRVVNMHTSRGGICEKCGASPAPWYWLHSRGDYCATCHDGIVAMSKQPEFEHKFSTVFIHRSQIAGPDGGVIVKK